FSTEFDFGAELPVLFDATAGFAVAGFAFPAAVPATGAVLFVRGTVDPGLRGTARIVVLEVEPELAAAVGAAAGAPPEARRAFAARRFASQAGQRMRSEATSVVSREGVNVAPQVSQIAMSGRGVVSDLGGGAGGPVRLVPTLLERSARSVQPGPGGSP